MKSSKTKITLTVLGSGTSTGVPIITCSCAVCKSKNPKNHRLRASVWFQVTKPLGGENITKSILIDTSTDLRQQALKNKIRSVDAVLFTHPHSDHVQGIDELRSYTFGTQNRLPLYGNEWTCTELKQRFSYIFAPAKVIEGGGIPQLNLNQIQAQDSALDIQGISVIPIPLHHGSKESVGYRIGDVAYVTDCSYIPPQSLDRLRGLSVLVLDCVRVAPHHGTHFNIDQALEAISELRPKRAFLTHLGHDFDYPKWAKKLPRGVSLAYDGLKISD